MIAEMAKNQSLVAKASLFAGNTRKRLAHDSCVRARALAQPPPIITNISLLRRARTRERGLATPVPKTKNERDVVKRHWRR